MTFAPSGLGWVTSDLPVQVLSRGVGVPAVLGRLLARLGSHRRSVLHTQDSVETNRGPHPRSTGSSHCGERSSRSRLRMPAAGSSMVAIALLRKGRAKCGSIFSLSAVTVVC